MKLNYKHILSLVTMGMACGLALPCAAGPTVIITPPGPPTVVITTPAPAPPPATVVVVPDTYIWDGDEYVGVVGDQYYYLGPGSVWIVMEPVRVHRFQLYVHDHLDWRGHMIRNEKYRHPEPRPMHDMHNHPPVNDHRDHDDHDHHRPPQ